MVIVQGTAVAKTKKEDLRKERNKQWDIFA